MSRRVTRRAALVTAGAAGAAGAVAIAVGRPARDGEGGRRATPTVPPARLPAEQHAWNAVLRTDADGNPLLPRHHRIVLLELARRPDPDGAARVEDALRTLERRYRYGPEGLLTLLAWGPAYFRAIGVATPIPPAAPLDADEAPEIDDVAGCLVLAADDERRLELVVRELFDGLATADAPRLDLRPVLRAREVRTGFTGAGLPRRAQVAADGLGVSRPIPREAPLFMGFRSGLRRNQATEADVTIGAGPFAGGTTLHLSLIALELEGWYELSEADRVARMFAPQLTPADVARFTDDAPVPVESVERTAARYGRVGHTQALAVMRRNGRPRILRRDVATVDGGGPGVHFLSLQRSIDDFVATRRAMTAARSRRAPQLTGQLNNGINEWMRVVRRGNYLVPPRAKRSFPLLREAGDA